MAINVDAAGGAGTHSFQKTNIHTDENYIYFTTEGANVIPPAFQPGVSFIYGEGVGGLGGVTDGTLLYVISDEQKKLQFSESFEGSSVDITDAGTVAGQISFNTPVVFDNRLNIDASTPTNQPVKYSTDGDPLTGLSIGETYYLKNVSISDFTGTQGLYSFTSHTFTSCGQTGRFGPTLSQMRSSYSTTWDAEYLNLGDYQGYQDWTVPVSGIYRFQARGASGYEGTGSGTAGRGAIIQGDISLTKGEIITIAVGQRGESPASGDIYGGSGGGTFVVRKSTTDPLLVAGGGSADADSTTGRDGQTTQLAGANSDGRPAGGSAGFGGTAAGGYSPGGGGFFSRGQDRSFGVNYSLGGGSFLDGLTIPTDLGRNNAYGGFGGGGSSDALTAGQTGGAGGYSGGGGARTTRSRVSGGGGGSFISQVVTNPATSTGTFDNLNSINGESIQNLSSYNTGDGAVDVTLVSDFTTGNEVYPTAQDAEDGTNRITIGPAGSSTHAFVPIALDFDDNLVVSATPHTLSDGEAITFNFTGTAPAGLNNSSIYYVDKVSNYSYRISSTPSPSFTTINLTQPAGLDVGSSSTLSRVIVNTATDTLAITNHGFLVDQPLRYDSGGGNAIGGLVSDNTYYVSEVVNANQIKLKTSLDAPTNINFTAPGTGTSHSFIFETVNALEDSLYIPNHGLVAGQKVIYNNNGNTSVQGLTDGVTYFISVIDSSIVQLAEDATLSTIANITGPGTGTHSLVLTSLDFANDVLTLPSHGFIQGELVQYDARGQQSIAGLTTNTPYYIIFVDGDNIKLATTPENAKNNVPVDIQQSPAGVGRHTLQSLTNTPDGIYVVNSVPAADSFTAEAKGNVPVIEKIFNPRSTIDLNLNAFRLPSHGFSTGTEVTYSQGESATDIEGLVDGDTYFVVTVNRDYIRLAATAEDAASGIVLTVTGFGTGVAHILTTSQINGNITGAGSVTVSSGSVLVNGSGTSFAKILKVGDVFRLYPDDIEVTTTFADSDVDTLNDRIDVVHSLSTGDSVRFLAQGGVSPSPLVDGYYYFVRDIGSGSALQLHASLSDAQNDLNAINFNTQGSGSSFELINSTPVGAILRRITAVGSDTQLTVDRPYANAYAGVGYSYPTFVYVRPQGYSLHRPFDGGVEMSVGAGTSFGQIIRQTRKYFRYQSGKGIQTSAGINFQPSIDLEYMKRVTDLQVECSTRRPHGLLSGLIVEISQAEDSFGDPSQVYNGKFAVTVVDQTTFRISPETQIVEDRAYGFPQFYVDQWSNGAVRSGMFDFQNGMFYEFDGAQLYCVRRSSTQQIAGTASALRGSEKVFGQNTSFSTQLNVGDFIVMRGQSYKVSEITSDTQISVRPEYKGSSGIEKEFDPQSQVDTSSNQFNIVQHGFTNALPVVYNSVDGEVIGGLVNGRTYYVQVVNNNAFKLLAAPDSLSTVGLSSTGTTNLHTLTPAKSGIIVTKTVDTRIPQVDWSIDPCDGSGPTGYNLDLSKIQMIYMDYSWYGAGKIRFGFKTTDGQVQYTHEFVHNNNLYESYFRSGNLPARYEVVTENNPTYIPYLFHWGTSVMMDGTFDDDNAYLFTASSQTLDIEGTTTKSFAATGINLANDLVTVQNHGFRTGDVLQFQSLATNGLPGENVQNPATAVVGLNTLPNLTNSEKYKAFVNSENLIHLTSENATISLGSTQTINFERTAGTVQVVTSQPHGITSASNYVGIYNIGIASIPDSYVGSVNVLSATTFTYSVTGSETVSSTVSTGVVIAEVINFTDQGNTQYTHFLFPEGSLNNTSGPNYQPMISLRLSPSVSEGLTGALGDRDVINRMQLRLREIGVSTDHLVDVKILLNPRLNNLNFVGVDSPSLTQVVEHTAQDTVSGGVQVFNFRASGGQGGLEETTTVDLSTLFELSNSILGGDSIFPDGPDILTIAVSRLTGNETLTSAKLSWAEAQA